MNPGMKSVTRLPSIHSTYLNPGINEKDLKRNSEPTCIPKRVNLLPKLKPEGLNQTLTNSIFERFKSEYKNEMLRVPIPRLQNSILPNSRPKLRPLSSIVDFKEEKSSNEIGKPRTRKENSTRSITTPVKENQTIKSSYLIRRSVDGLDFRFLNAKKLEILERRDQCSEDEEEEITSQVKDEQVQITDSENQEIQPQSFKDEEKNPKIELSVEILPQIVEAPWKRSIHLENPEPCSSCIFHKCILKEHEKENHNIFHQNRTLRELINEQDVSIVALKMKCQSLLREQYRLNDTKKLLKLKGQLLQNEISKVKLAIQIKNKAKKINSKAKTNRRPTTAEQYTSLLEGEQKAHQLNQELIEAETEKTEWTELVNNILYTLHMKGYKELHNSSTGNHVLLNSEIPGKLLELKGRDIVRLKNINGPANGVKKIHIQKKILKNIIGAREKTIQALLMTIKQREEFKESMNPANVSKKPQSPPNFVTLYNPSTNSECAKMENDLFKFANSLKDIFRRNPKTLKFVIESGIVSETKYPVMYSVINSLQPEFSKANSSAKLTTKLPPLSQADCSVNEEKKNYRSFTSLLKEYTPGNLFKTIQPNRKRNTLCGPGWMDQRQHPQYNFKKTQSSLSKFKKLFKDVGEEK